MVRGMAKKEKKIRHKFCVREENKIVKIQRESCERSEVKSILGNMNTAEGKFEEEAEEITGLERYQDGRNGPLKIKLESHMTTETILNW